MMRLSDVKMKRLAPEESAKKENQEHEGCNNAVFPKHNWNDSGEEGKDKREPPGHGNCAPV